MNPGPIFALVLLFNMNEINYVVWQKNNCCLGYCKFISFCQNKKNAKSAKLERPEIFLGSASSHQGRFITMRIFKKFENYINKNKNIITPEKVYNQKSFRKFENYINKNKKI